MNTRRLIATFVLVATPAAAAGCTATEVQDFFTGQGHPVSADLAQRIADLGTIIEQRAAHHDDDCSTTTTTTTAPTTTAAPTQAVRASFGTDGCDHRSSSRKRAH